MKHQIPQRGGIVLLPFKVLDLMIFNVFCENFFIFLQQTKFLVNDLLISRFSLPISITRTVIQTRSSFTLSCEFNYKKLGTYTIRFIDVTLIYWNRRPFLSWKKFAGKILSFQDQFISLLYIFCRKHIKSCDIY